MTPEPTSETPIPREEAMAGLQTEITDENKEPLVFEISTGIPEMTPEERLNENPLSEKERKDIDELFYHFAPRPPQERPAVSRWENFCPNPGKCRIAPNTISVQLDEVLSRSQEKGRKVNETFNATIEDDVGQVFYLTARSNEELQKLIACHPSTLGVMSGKQLEVLADSARRIALWAAGIKETMVSKILCWWHLCKRVYEALSGLGWEKQKKKAMERVILGMLWRGDVAKAVWILWGLRSEAKAETDRRFDGVFAAKTGMDRRLFAAEGAGLMDCEHSCGKVERLSTTAQQNFHK